MYLLNGISILRKGIAPCGAGENMKTYLLKGIAAVSFSALSAYLGQVFLPVAILVCAMLADYISGMVKAWMTSSLSSKVGITGIVKKLCYLLAVCAGAGADYIFTASGAQGISGFECPVACMVAVWLIINELISILENLGGIGVPLPKFLVKLTERLMNGDDEG